GQRRVLSRMSAGGCARPGLGPEVAKRIRPWRAFADRAIGDGLAGTALDAVVSRESVGHAVVALYLGLELLAHLDGDRRPAAALFDRAATLAPLVGALTTGGGRR